MDKYLKENFGGLRLPAVLLSALTLVRMIKDRWKLELGGVIADALKFYHYLIHEPVTWLASNLDLPIPSAMMINIGVLWIAIATIFLRTFHIVIAMDGEERDDKAENLPQRKRTSILFLASLFTNLFATLLIYLFAPLIIAAFLLFSFVPHKGRLMNIWQPSGFRLTFITQTVLLGAAVATAIYVGMYDSPK